MFRFVRRNDVEPLLPFEKIFCLDNRMAMFCAFIATLFTSLFAWILVLLDLVSWSDYSFIIHGGFPAQWRRSFWKGFVAVDIVMAVFHLVVIIISLVGLIAIPLPFKVYRLRPVVHAYFVFMIMYVICEFGVSVYIYSWYGLAAWRRPYLVFEHVFYVFRFLINILFIVIAASYEAEISLSLEFPEGHEMSKDNLIEAEGRSDFGYSNYAGDVYNVSKA